jgi:hypothetical protein
MNLGLTSAMFERHPSDHPDSSLAGQFVSRQTLCRCGETFEQTKLAEAWVAGRTTDQRAALSRDVPDYFVPQQCPRCERRALERDRDPHGILTAPDEDWRFAL